MSSVSGEYIRWYCVWRHKEQHPGLVILWNLRGIFVLFLPPKCYVMYLNGVSHSLVQAWLGLHCVLSYLASAAYSYCLQSSRYFQPSMHLSVKHTKRNTKLKFIILVFIWCETETKATNDMPSATKEPIAREGTKPIRPETVLCFQTVFPSSWISFH